VTGGTTTTSSYGYDADGDTTTRPGQSLTYDAEGRVSTVTAGSSSQADVYDASGNLLLEKDSTAGTTLFLGATELHLASGATTASAVRTYTANGIPVAERSTVAGVSGSTETWLGADAQGTVDLQMNATTGTFGVRLQDPFGNARGTSTTTWGDGHGFLNATTDALSGLVQLGARMYDATTGRFLSVDPVLKPTDPQQNNGYSYAHNTLVDLADPNGLDPAEYWNPATAPNHPYVPPGGHAPVAPGNATTVEVSPHVYDSANDPHLKGMMAQYRALGGTSHSSEILEIYLWHLICVNGGDTCGTVFRNTIAHIQQGGLTDGVIVGGGLGSTFYFITDPVESGGAGQVVVRQLSDPESMVGATFDQVRTMIPEGWIEKPMTKGLGTRWLSPGRNPGARGYIEYSEEGSPGTDEPVHAGGAYIKVSVGGEDWRAAGAGNSVLDDPDAPNVAIFGRGSTGPIDLSQEFKFEVGAP
jgi:RHS repeat-associated protein